MAREAIKPRKYYVVIDGNTNKPYVAGGQQGEYVVLWFDPISANGFIDYLVNPGTSYVRECMLAVGGISELDESIEN